MGLFSNTVENVALLAFNDGWHFNFAQMLVVTDEVAPLYAQTFLEKAV